jgi:hypothetical protein
MGEGAAEGPVPPRLHVLMRRESPVAVVIRRGPSRAVCAIAWSLRGDSFQLGQWLKGRIYPLRSDLSADGRHIVYFASNFGARAPDPPSWTAVSCVPWLKAIELWTKDDAWHGGGMFGRGDDWRLNDGYGHQEALRTSRVRRVPDYPYPELAQAATEWGAECLRIYVPRMLREGWTLHAVERPDAKTRHARFRKPIGAAGVLEKVLVATSATRAAGQGVYSEWHRILPGNGAPARDYPGWEWAELQGSRLVWAERGCLHAARPGREGLRDVTLLHDFTSMRFQAIAAPY